MQPPAFRKKQDYGSYQTSNHYNSKKVTVATPYNSIIRFLDRKHISFAKVGRIRIAFSHKLYKRIEKMCVCGAEVRLTKATVSKDSCHSYFVSFQIASDMPYAETFTKTGKEIGIDFNLDNFLTDSEGNVVDNPRFYRKMKAKLAKAQRKLGKRCARSKKEHRPIAKARNYQKQRKNHALAMSISDAGWRTFLSMLEYKAAVHGKLFRTVDPKYTTQTCSECGHVMKEEQKLTLKDRQWTCPVCGHFHIRDHNAAKNILAKAIA